MREQERPEQSNNVILADQIIDRDAGYALSPLYHCLENPIPLIEAVAILRGFSLRKGIPEKEQIGHGSFDMHSVKVRTQIGSIIEIGAGVTPRNRDGDVIVLGSDEYNAVASKMPLLKIDAPIIPTTEAQRAIVDNKKKRVFTLFGDCTTDYQRIDLPDSDYRNLLLKTFIENMDESSLRLLTYELSRIASIVGYTLPLSDAF